MSTILKSSRDIKSLCAAIHPDTSCTITPFFRPHHPFSQWYPAPFTPNDGTKITFKTAEHYMMYKKAELFEDRLNMARILKADSPKDAKMFGRQVQKFSVELWERMGQHFVIEGNLCKFIQHPEIRQKLLDTGDSLIVEASPWDKIWGAGVDDTDKRLPFPHQWPGENRLGFCLMEVRDILMELRGG